MPAMAPSVHERGTFTMESLMFGLFNSRPAAYAEIDPRDVKLATYRVIDVRQPEELAQLKPIAQAENVPLGTVAAKMGGWDKSQAILVVCRSGGRSGQACQTLAAAGFTNITNLRGGMMGWHAAGLPTK